MINLNEIPKCATGKKGRLTMLTGGIVTKYDPLYIDAKLNYNRAFNKCPLIINFCFNDEDVSNAIKYARENDIRFRIRSGRHDYEANSNLNCGLVIDISNIDYVRVNKNNDTANIGAGILSGKMYEELFRYGYTLPSGTCKDVGFASLTSCGGVGYAARYLGLSCDNLLEVEIINYKGEKIIANNYENKDLFWALRGGLGANFGVIVSLTYKITSVCNASTYEINWDFKYFNQVLGTWQNVANNFDNRLTTTVSVSKEKNQLNLRSSGQFFGNKEELAKIITPLLTIAPMISVEIEEGPYIDALNKWNDACFAPNKFKATGTYIENPIDDNGLENLKYEMLNSPDTSTNIYEFIGLGGKVSEVNNNETAYPHREAIYLLELKSIWECNKCACDSINWVNKNKDYLDILGIGTYRGFTNFDLENWQYQYYGQNYRRLQDVKCIYDPENVFCFPQSIEV